MFYLFVRRPSPAVDLPQNERKRVNVSHLESLKQNGVVVCRAVALGAVWVQRIHQHLGSHVPSGSNPEKRAGLESWNQSKGRGRKRNEKREKVETLYIFYFSYFCFAIILLYLLLGWTSICPVSPVNLAASPKSAMAPVPSPFTRMFRDLMSRCAIAGLPLIDK